MLLVGSTAEGHAESPRASYVSVRCFIYRNSSNQENTPALISIRVLYYISILSVGFDLIVMDLVHLIESREFSLSTILQFSLGVNDFNISVHWRTIHITEY